MRLVWREAVARIVASQLLAWAVLALPATAEAVLKFAVTPAATGQQLVRSSLPFAKGKLPQGWSLVARSNAGDTPVGVRPLSWYPQSTTKRSVRRAIVSFPHEFTTDQPANFHLEAVENTAKDSVSPSVLVRFDQGELKLQHTDGRTIQSQPVWPMAAPDANWEEDTVERNSHFQWYRWAQQDDRWGRAVEVRVDGLGQVTLVAHLQRREAPGNWIPEFGWDVRAGDHLAEIELERRHSFASRRPHRRETYEWQDLVIAHPAAPWKRRGEILVHGSGNDLHYRYLRSTGDDRVPMQAYAWRRAELVISPQKVALPTPNLTSPHKVYVDWRDWDKLYDVGPALDLRDQPLLANLLDYHHRATLATAAVGNDWGNLTTYQDGQPSGGVFGMNRLNHNPAVFFEGMRIGDRSLVETAINWCDNFYDLTIWWGPKKTGGTRYNNLRATNETPPDDDWHFMWRGDKSKTFCTKGYDSFLLAYEETGDPRFKHAFEVQSAYAAEHVHTNDGECRNIGDVLDFVRAFEYTGDEEHLRHALRLFQELRSALGPDNLFDQRGKPIVPNPDFIDEDDVMGRRYPFAKPYIIGYALQGCPRLAAYFPDEPRLRDTVRAVADFMARSQDPLGGWRYPHPASSRVVASQAMEHARQLVHACELLGPEPAYLDAIERTLRLRIWIWRRTGKILNNLIGWETSTGAINDPLDIYNLYDKPADRDPGRDYREGRPQLGISAPEGIVYFPEVLRFYLEHRSASRLLESPEPDSPLGQVLARLDDANAQTHGVRDGLPVFHEQVKARTTFPLAWQNSSGESFDAWREKARDRVRDALLAAPPKVPFNPVVTGTRQREGYTCRKIEFNLSADSRVRAYLLVPDGAGPFPAVLLLHDHGAEFRIGKEKVVEPWGCATEQIDLARAWVDENYGGRFLGDELACRGYVCLAVDALNWSERGGAGFDGQQALASNLMHLGMSLAGVIAHDDLRSAELLAAQPEVDPNRIAAMGLSMGSFRTWQLAALSPHIDAGVAVCWMATVHELQVPGNNQTEGHSAFSMLHPGLLDELDYPDIASIACPKPMLFYNGRQDRLFPVPSVEAAYAKMRAVWKSQGAADRLVTKLWDAPHEFNREMQEEAFAWLDVVLQKAQ